MQLILKKRRVSDGNLKFTPIFLELHQEIIDSIAELINNNYEINLGKRIAKINDDEEYFINKFSDIRILRGLNLILMKFYYEHSHYSHDTGYSPEKLRIQMYKYFEQNKISFILPKDKENFFLNYSEETNIVVQNLKKDLFADHSLFKILTRKKQNEQVKDPPLPKMIIYLYNNEIIRTLLNRSYWIDFDFKLENVNGTLFKNLIFLSKRLGLHFESNNLNNGAVNIRILGPQELVGKSTKYGKNLNILFLKNIDFFVSNNLIINLLINFFGQKREIFIDLSILKDLLNTYTRDISDIDQVFDSKVEKKFNDIFKILNKNWEITREPIIIENGIIMIPDFKLKYFNTIVFMEIVGFWTERYLTHKFRKIKLLENKYKDMILFVDENLKFPETKLKTFYYGKNMHVTNFIQFLKEKYETPYIKENIEKLKTDKTSIISSINKLSNKLKSFSFLKLVEEISTFKNIETINALITENYFDDKQNIRFLIAINARIIINLDIIIELQNNLIKLSEQKDNWEGEELLKIIVDLNLGMDNGHIRIALKILGCTWKIKNLVQEFILLPERFNDLKEISRCLYF
ncbi:MAG: hypothetical protein HeimC3_13330 [Candidatus Heimdallarchaeota archaeon LC_3]|nr:MAG: hypothetical protein HeimC3_13330 [Candidatus Heimdallarchaeota archaeon LC_3]